MKTTAPAMMVMVMGRDDKGRWRRRRWRLRRPTAAAHTELSGLTVYRWSSLRWSIQ